MKGYDKLVYTRSALSYLLGWLLGLVGLEKDCVVEAKCMRETVHCLMIALTASIISL